MKYFLTFVGQIAICQKVNFENKFWSLSLMKEFVVFGKHMLVNFQGLLNKVVSLS